MMPRDASSFNGSFVRVVLDVGERRAGCGHAGDIHGIVRFALIDVRVGLCRIFHNIIHPVQTALAVFRAVGGD